MRTLIKQQSHLLRFNVSTCSEALSTKGSSPNTAKLNIVKMRPWSKSLDQSFNFEHFTIWSSQLGMKSLPFSKTNSSLKRLWKVLGQDKQVKIDRCSVVSNGVMGRGVIWGLCRSRISLHAFYHYLNQTKNKKQIFVINYCRFFIYLSLLVN